MSTFKLLERVKIPGVFSRHAREALGITTDWSLPIIAWQYVVDCVENLPTEAYPKQIAYVVGVGIYVVSPEGWIFNEVYTEAVNKSKTIHSWNNTERKWIVIDSIAKIKE